MGATETRRSIFPREKSSERPIFTGSFDSGVSAGFVQPGKPDQNAFIERFNRTYRDEMLDAYVFESIEQVREVTESWLREYNEERPHDSLGRVPPLTFMPRQIAGESIYKLCP
jgi:transposase InsO family protein